MFRRQFTWCLAVWLAAFPSLVAAQQPTYVTQDAVAGAVVKLRRILTAPQLEMLPVEIMSAASKKEVGIDIVNIESLAVFVEVMGGPPQFGVALQFAQPVQWSDLKRPPNLPLEEVELAGRPYWRSTQPMAPGFYAPDDRTLLIGPDDVIGKMLVQSRTGKKGPLAELLTSRESAPDAVGAIRMVPLRPLIDAQVRQLPLPPQLEDAKQIPGLLDNVQISLNLAEQVDGRLGLHATDADAAVKLEKIVANLLTVAEQQTMAQMAAQMPRGDDPVDVATRQYAERITRLIFSRLKPTRQGDELAVEYTESNGGQVAVISVLVGLLLPAVQAAREAARRQSSTNNMRQIALAMHNYHDAHGHFPASAIVDEDGKPLLSWRVALLPYLDHQRLYDEFHLDEPWDSEHNIKLLDRMPAVFHNPSSPVGAPVSSYLVPTGKGTIFESPKQESSFRDIKDGASNTIMLFEVDPGAGVTWTKPEDLAVDRNAPLKGLGKAHPGGFLVGLADGAVQFMAQNVNEETIVKLIDKSDGALVDF